MLYRVIPDVPDPEADLDTPAMAAASVAVDRAEQRRRMLERLADMAMNLTERLQKKAQDQIEADKPTQPSQDALKAFNVTAQTVRRTLALEAKLAEGVKLHREALIADRNARREEREKAKLDAILFGVHDAYAAQTPEPAYSDRIETLMEDVEDFVREYDEFREWRRRPVGETVERLCAMLDLDPKSCVKDGDTWIVARPLSDLELTISEPHEEEQTADPPDWDPARYPP